MNKLLITFVSALFASTSISNATVLLSDTFTYPDGSIVGAPGSPWQPNTGTAGSALVAGGRLDWSFNRTEDIAALLSMVIEANGPIEAVYSSFTIRFTALPNLAGSYLAHFTGNPLSAHRCRVWAATTNAAAGKLRLSIVNSSTGNATTAQWPTDLDTNTTYKVVTRYVVATGISTLWIDPVTMSDTSVTASDTPGVTNILHYAFRQTTGIGNSFIDDLKVGTSFEDVAGLNNPPTISGIPTQRIDANTSTAPLAFTIGDVETPVDNLTLGRTSSNPALVPENGVIFGGTGSNRTVTITPVANQEGTAIITLSVTDGGGASTTTSFQLGVGLPTISSIPNQSTAVNTVLGPIAFTIGDVETTAENLTLNVSSSNQALVPDGNITFGGSGSHRTVTISPAPDQTGLTQITLGVSDGTSTVSNSFVLTVFPLLGLLRMDDFNRPDGPLVQFDGAWLSNGGTGGTNAQQMQIVNGRVKVHQDQSEDCSTEMPPFQSVPTIYATSSGTILFASMSITLTNLPTPAGSYFAHFRDTGNGFRARVFASRGGASAGHFRLGIANNAAAISASGQIATDLSLNTSYLVVVRYNVGTGESTLWLNPTSESDPSITATDAPFPVDIYAFTFRQNSGIGVVCVDDLKIGTTFSDVAPIGLRITNMGTNVVISWPAAAQGYALQSTEGLSPPDWSDYSDQGSVAGDRKVVSITGVTGTRFFRLFKP